MAIGQGRSDEAARELAAAWREIGRAERALDETKRWWADTLSTLRIETNDPAFDRMVNDWLPYQALTARLWGRCGPSQRGGATGYRDQLQDVLPFLFTQPELARKQILLHAAQQFPDGDVLQWWHRSREGSTGIAARNRIYDIQLWLPYLTARYVKATGDEAILHEHVPFLEARPIPAGADGVVIVPRQSREAASLYEHCRRAIEASLALLGPNGLPLMGTGDWNDGLNRVGHKGRGESVWLGFLLHDVLRDFAGIALVHGGEEARDRYVTAAPQAQACAWTGCGARTATCAQSTMPATSWPSPTRWPLPGRRSPGRPTSSAARLRWRVPYASSSGRTWSWSSPRPSARTPSRPQARSRTIPRACARMAGSTRTARHG